MTFHIRHSDTRFHTTMCGIPLSFRGPILGQDPNCIGCELARKAWDRKMAQAYCEYWRKYPRTRIHRWADHWAHFGDGDYEVLDWFPIVVATAGLGIPVVMAMKRVARVVLRFQKPIKRPPFIPPDM